MAEGIWQLLEGSEDVNAEVAVHMLAELLRQLYTGELTVRAKLVK